MEIQDYKDKVNSMMDILEDKFSGVIILHIPEKSESMAAAFFAERFGIDIDSGMPKLKLENMEIKEKLQRLHEVFDSVAAVTKALEELGKRYEIFLRKTAQEIIDLGGDI